MRCWHRGDIGFAESYLDGDWDSPDLARLLTVLADNRDALARAVHGSAFHPWLHASVTC